MLWSEFETIAGYRVTAETYYNVIEPLYMGSDMDKCDFIKLLNRAELEYKPESVITPKIRSLMDRRDLLNDFIQYAKDDIGYLKTLITCDINDKKDIQYRIKRQRGFIKEYRAELKEISYILE